MARGMAAAQPAAGFDKASVLSVLAGQARPHLTQLLCSYARIAMTYILSLNYVLYSCMSYTMPVTPMTCCISGLLRHTPKEADRLLLRHTRAPCSVCSSLRTHSVQLLGTGMWQTARAATCLAVSLVPCRVRIFTPSSANSAAICHRLQRHVHWHSSECAGPRWWPHPGGSV